MEVWKDVPGYGGHYQASSKGRVRSKDRVVRKFSAVVGAVVDQNYKGRLLTCKPGRDGYVHVHLGVDGKKSSVHVGRLVLMAFVGDQPDGMECCHCNGNASDNRIENLRWDSHYNNNQDRLRHGTYAHGEKHHMARLTEEQVLEIYASNESGKFLAKKYGVHESKISAIRCGKTWKRITGGVPRKVKMSERVTDKIGWNGARDIRRRYSEGEGKHDLARDYGVGWGAIQDVLMNRKWVE